MSYIGKITAGGTTCNVGSTLYGTCDTAAGTAAKVAVVAGFDTLETGVTVHIKFTNSNTSTGTITLAIKPASSGTATTAKNVYKYGTTKPGSTTATSWEAGSIVSFTYDGNYWQMNDHIDNLNDSVTQINSTNNSDLRLLLSYSAIDDTATYTCRKSTNFKANPSTGNLTIGGQLTDKYGLQSFRSLTTAQYNALSSTDKNNGTYYHLTDSYSDVSFDSNVSQTPTTADHDYRVLLSGSDNDTASVEGALKNTNLTYNPNSHTLKISQTSTSSGITTTYNNNMSGYGLDLALYTGSTLQYTMGIRPGDINYSGKWDGTNTSLKTAISTIKQSLVDYFTKSYTITASSERAFIKDLATQAYSYMISKSLPFMLVNASWEGNNTGYMIISSTRRFQVQVGDSMSLGILNAAGTDLAQLRSVTTTAHP